MVFQRLVLAYFSVLLISIYHTNIFAHASRQVVRINTSNNHDLSQDSPDRTFGHPSAVSALGSSISWQVHSWDDIRQWGQGFTKGNTWMKIDMHWQSPQQCGQDGNVTTSNNGCFLLTHNVPAAGQNYYTGTDVISFISGNETSEWFSSSVAKKHIALCFKFTPDLYAPTPVRDMFEASAKNIITTLNDTVTRLSLNLEFVLDGASPRIPGYAGTYFPSDSDIADPTSCLYIDDGDCAKDAVLDPECNPIPTQSPTKWVTALCPKGYGKFANGSYPSLWWEPSDAETILAVTGNYTKCGIPFANGFRMAINIDPVQYELYVSPNTGRAVYGSITGGSGQFGPNCTSARSLQIGASNYIIVTASCDTRAGTANHIAILSASTVAQFATVVADAPFPPSIPTVDINSLTVIHEEVNGTTVSARLLATAPSAKSWLCFEVALVGSALSVSPCGVLTTIPLFPNGVSSMQVLSATTESASVVLTAMSSSAPCIGLNVTYASIGYQNTSLSLNVLTSTCLAIPAGLLSAEEGSVSLMPAPVSSTGCAGGYVGVAMAADSQSQVYAAALCVTTTPVPGIHTCGDATCASTAQATPMASVIDVGERPVVSAALDTSGDVAILSTHGRGYCDNSDWHNKRAAPALCDAKPTPSQYGMAYNFGSLQNWITQLEGADTSSRACAGTALVHGMFAQGTSPSGVLYNGESGLYAMVVSDGFPVDGVDPSGCGIPLSSNGLSAIAWTLPTLPLPAQHATPFPAPSLTPQPKPSPITPPSGNNNGTHVSCELCRLVVSSFLNALELNPSYMDDLMTEASKTCKVTKMAFGESESRCQNFMLTYGGTVVMGLLEGQLTPKLCVTIKKCNATSSDDIHTRHIDGLCPDLAAAIETALSDTNAWHAAFRAGPRGIARTLDTSHEKGRVLMSSLASVVIRHILDAEDSLLRHTCAQVSQPRSLRAQPLVMK